MLDTGDSDINSPGCGFQGPNSMICYVVQCDEKSIGRINVQRNVRLMLMEWIIFY